MDNKRHEEQQYKKMTSEPVGKLLLSLSVPTIISMLVTTTYNIVDAAFVGLLGTSQSGATGVVNGYMAILQAIAFMCGQGAGSIMSRKLGAKEKSEADKFASTGVVLSFLTGLTVAFFSLIFLHPLLKTLGSTDTILPYARTYLLFILASAPFFTSSFTMNNLLRYEGKAKFGTMALMTGAVLNIAGDALCICVFKMGIFGAGLSTAVSQFIGFLVIISMYIRKKAEVSLSIKNVSRAISDYYEIVTTGLPSLFRQGLNAAATMVLNSCASVYGDSAVAAMSIVSRLGFFPMAVAIGIGQGFQPISGFNYGAKRNDRVKEAFKKALFGSEVALILFAIPMCIFAPNFVRILRDDPEVIEIGSRALRLLCYSQPALPLTFMTEMGFQSTGQKKLALVSSSLRSGIIFIPSLIVMSMLRGLSGVEEAQPLSFIISFFISIYFVRVYFKKLSAN